MASERLSYEMTPETQISAQGVVLEIAGVVISIISAKGTFDERSFAPFESKGEPEVVIRVRTGAVLASPASRPPLCNRPVEGWVVHPVGGLYEAIYCEKTRPTAPMKMIFAKDARAFDFFTSAPPGTVQPGLRSVYVMPLMLALADRNGMLLHSSGLQTGNGALLFSGPSGVGKTTMAKLWHDLGEGIVLNDDVCAVRQSDGDFGLFGTPWGGGSNSRTAQQERLRAVFFLGHGFTNRCMPMKPARALSLLVSQAFLPGWDAARTQRVLDTCTDLVQETPCFQLLFRPTPDVVSLIKSLVHTVP